MNKIAPPHHHGAANQLVKGERIGWLDIAKGICILQMVAFHSNLPYIGSDYLISSTIPCFFFLSGFTFKEERRRVVKAVDKLIIPYLTVFGLFNILNYFISGDLFSFPRSVWFLYVMFGTIVLYFLICKIFKNIWQRDIVCFICLIMGILLNSQYDYTALKLDYLTSMRYNFEPIKLGSMISMIPFFHIGHRMGQMRITNSMIPLWIPMSAVLLSLLFAFLCKGKLLLSVCYNQWWGNGIFIVMVILVCMAAIITVAIKLKHNRLLEYFGKYSLIVLCFHIFVLYFIRTPWAFVIILALSPLVIYVIKRYTPFLFGQKKSITETIYDSIENNSK